MIFCRAQQFWPNKIGKGVLVLKVTAKTAGAAWRSPGLVQVLVTSPGLDHFPGLGDFPGLGYFPGLGHFQGLDHPDPGIDREIDPDPD